MARLEGRGWRVKMERRYLLLSTQNNFRGSEGGTKGQKVGNLPSAPRSVELRSDFRSGRLRSPPSFSRAAEGRNRKSTIKPQLLLSKAALPLAACELWCVTPGGWWLSQGLGGQAESGESVG